MWSLLVTLPSAVPWAPQKLPSLPLWAEEEVQVEKAKQSAFSYLLSQAFSRHSQSGAASGP